jgi:hypothetical protein
MTKSLVPVALLLATACGGNFSNSDIEFFYALPSKQDLSSKLPETGAQGIGLEVAAGLAQQRQGLNTCDDNLYQGTRCASAAFNGTLDEMLAFIEAIREHPPTSRTEDNRTWGPFSPPELPDFEVKVVVVRASIELFTYAIQVRRKVASADWFSVLEGQFEATGGIRKGRGSLRLNVKGGRDYGLPDGDGTRDLELIEATYKTDREPIEVRLHWVLRPGLDFTELDYVYREEVDHGGMMGFVVRKVGELGPAPSVFSILSRWLPTGRGRSDATVISGDGVGHRQTDCWNDRLQVIFREKTWTWADNFGSAQECIAPGSLDMP